MLDSTNLVGLNLFTYCYNNPVNLSDRTGQIPFADGFYDEVFQQIGEWLYLLICSDENERGPNGELSLNARIKQTGKSILYNAELSLGLGLGLYAEGDVLNLVFENMVENGKTNHGI